MSSLREQLQGLRKDADSFFADAEDTGNRAYGGPKPQVAYVMEKVGDAIQKATLLAPTALSSHQKNTRSMVSALRFKQYDCWDQRTEWAEDILVGKREAGEGEYDVPIAEAKALFMKALDSTVDLLDLADPVKTSLRVASKSVQKRGPKPIDPRVAGEVDRIVTRIAPDGHWQPKADAIGQALEHGFCHAPNPEDCDELDHEKIPLPRGWRKKRASWDTPPDDATLIKAINERLKKAGPKPTTDTPS